ncbi:fatty acid-binding protein homolog 8-like [Biomphalaria glabrata]|uniref:Fatty acid-binding protein homolog 8-like n=1 Tax=Biomphalaria glabrata TaxID=6526 RepID=A0A9U8E056_BIOGL|nr:fatty acid-binding protein homolog 8-like [Biomphalaria glabrata]
MEDLLGLGLDSVSPVTAAPQVNTNLAPSQTESLKETSAATTVEPPSSVATETLSQPQTTPATASPTDITAGKTATKPNSEMFTLKQEEPSTEVLKEIQAKFGGRWKLVRSDPYAEYLKAAGVGLLTRTLAGNSLPEQVFSVRGDQIYVSFHSTLHNQNYVYQLETAVENLVEKSRQSVFASYKDGKLILLLTSLEEGWNKTQGVERFINDLGEHVMIHTCGNVVCRRYFTRLPDLVTLPPLAQ